MISPRQWLSWLKKKAIEYAENTKGSAQGGCLEPWWSAKISLNVGGKTSWKLMDNSYAKNYGL